VAQHEFVHYLVRHNFPSAPLWFNEGLAEYYSTFTSDGERMRVGSPVERHVRWLKKQGELDLATVVTADRRSATYHAPDQVGSFYAGSWALVHYLLSGSTERLLQTADFFLYLEEGMEGRKAFELAYDLRLSTLEKELLSYLQQGDLPYATFPIEEFTGAGRARIRPAAPENVLYNLGDLVLHMGRTEAAGNHFHRALDHHPEHGASLGGLALVRDFHQRFDEAAVLYKDAIENRSQEPITYLAWGRHLLTRADALRGEEAGLLGTKARAGLEVALDLYPDYGEALVLLGMSHRLPGGEPLEGVRSLQRARKLLPHRPDLIVEEVRLYAMAGEAGRGEALIERVLVPRGNFELEEKARTVLERQSLLYDANQALAAGELERGLALFDQAISATSDTQLRREMEEQYEVLRRQIEGN
jgi:tetratricopeptide (TPR) repeat protein